MSGATAIAVDSAFLFVAGLAGVHGIVQPLRDRPDPIPDFVMGSAVIVLTLPFALLAAIGAFGDPRLALLLAAWVGGGLLAGLYGWRTRA